MGNTTRGGRGKQVSATVAPELYAALDDYAWENRRNRTDVVRQAVEEYAQRNGIWTAEPLTLEEKLELNTEYGKQKEHDGNDAEH